MEVLEEQRTEIGTYPEGWSIDRVDSVFDLIQGKQVSERNRVGDNQRPFLRTKNVFWNRLELTELDRMHFSDVEEARYTLKPGDLLLCEGGDVGRTAMWQGEVERCYIQNHLHRLRAYHGMVDPQYGVFWFWYAFNVGNLYIGRGNKTTIPNMSRSKLAELPIALPPLAEQQRIGQVLSTVQAAIEQQERLICTTTELKQALMQKLFTEGLRGEAQKETEIGAVPESWEVVLLDEVMNCHDGKRRPVTQSDRIPGPYPYYGASGVTDYVEGYLFDGDYLLIAEDGENLASRKLPIAFIARGKFWVNNHAHVLSMKEGNLAFYEQYIAQMEIKDYLSGTTRPKLNKGLMMTMKLPRPSVAEQNEIAAALMSCDTKRQSAERKLNTLQALFRTLLHELMSGKVRVIQEATN